MLGKHSPQNPAHPARKRPNLEFDFAGLSVPRKKNVRKPRPSDPAAPLSTMTGSTASSAKTDIPAQPAATTVEIPPQVEPSPFPSNSTPTPTHPRNPEVSMAQPHPTPITAGRSIDRQVKEQKAVSSLLHGAGLALVCSILVIAGLASLGGYVLYRQLQDQSATVALLEQNTKQRLFEMEMDLIKRDNDLAKNLEQANLRVTALTSQFEEYRYQTTQTLAELRARNRELEKQLSLNQQKIRDQQSVLARLR
ncbi:MAG: hypothetical protein SFU85_08905 [Candidatus Methylacidiphilales bacterium]|nr:hypothetical protein [Candidatus Methylacidiphilales bacterium]